MNQSKTKSLVTLVALFSLVLVFALLIVSVVEIRQVYVYKQRIASQEREIERLQNAKDYYESQLDKDNGYNSGDFVFGEE